MKSNWLRAMLALILLAVLAGCGGGGGGGSTTPTGGDTGNGGTGTTPPPPTPTVLHYSNVTLGVEFSKVRIITPLGVSDLVNKTGGAMPNCFILTQAPLSNGYYVVWCQGQDLHMKALSVDPTTGNAYLFDATRDGAMPSQYAVTETSYSPTNGVTLAYGSGVYGCMRFCQLGWPFTNWGTPPFDDADAWAPTDLSKPGGDYFSALLSKEGFGIYLVHSSGVPVSPNPIPGTVDPIMRWQALVTISN